MTSIWLFVAGLVTSFAGSVVGLGGGFLLVPALRLLFGMAPAMVAGTSLALVVVTNGTASISYAFDRRIRFRTGLAIAAGGVPASIVGAHLVRAMAPRAFDLLLAALTLAVALRVLLRGANVRSNPKPNAPWPVLAGIGALIGILSGLFGAGGGVVLIPALIYFTDLSPHEITATAQFAVLFVSAAGLAAHVVQHDLQIVSALPLSIAGCIGGLLGARMSSRLRPARLLALVGIALVVAAIALLARDVQWSGRL